jgi:transposase
MEQEAILRKIEETLQNTQLPTYKNKRLQVIKQHLLGNSAKDIANELDYHLRSVQRYIKEYREKGEISLFDTPSPGNKGKLDVKQEEKIKKELQFRPSKYGYLLPEWNGKLLVKYIHKTYGISLSLETCRQLLHNSMIKNKEESVEKRRNEFKKRLQQYREDPNCEVWFLSDIFLGFRKRAKNKKGKLPYYPEDLLVDPTTIPHIDFSEKAKKERVLCVQSVKSNHFFFRHYTERVSEDKRYIQAIKKIYKATNQPQIVLLYPNLTIHNRNLMFRVKESNKSFMVEYVPPQCSDLNPLTALKDELMRKFKLKDKQTNQRVKLSEDHLNQVLQYLHQLSPHSV